MIYGRRDGLSMLLPRPQSDDPASDTGLVQMVGGISVSPEACVGLQGKPGYGALYLCQTMYHPVEGRAVASRDE